MEPEKKPEPIRDKQLNVRVSVQEKRLIEEQAKAAGYAKVGAYLRDVGKGTEIKQRLSPELRRQLVGIGNNLNQLARRANSNTAYTTDEKTILEIINFLKLQLA